MKMKIIFSIETILPSQAGLSNRDAERFVPWARIP